MKQATKILRRILLLLAVLLTLGSGFSCFAHDRGEHRDHREVLWGKRILIIGDSITTGYGLDESIATWTDLLETQCGMVVSYDSISGSTIGSSPYEGGCKFPMCERELPQEEFDIIFIQGSTNDWRYEIPVGEDLCSRDPYNMMGGLNILLDRVEAQYPEAKVLCMTPWNSNGRLNVYEVTTEAYSRAVHEVCGERKVPCFFAVDPEISGVDANSPEFLAQYFISREDPWHLNEQGHAMFYPIIAGWIAEEFLRPPEGNPPVMYIKFPRPLCGYMEVSRAIRM